MYKITHEIYLYLAELLQEEIFTLNYYSGIIEFIDEETDYRFAASIIIYRDKSKNIDEQRSTIKDLVPVWWELKTTTNKGEQINDFDFTILKKIIIQCS